MAGSVLAVGVLGMTTALALSLGAVGGAAVASQRAAATADAAALAAADALSGAVIGEPCDRAKEVAAASGAAVAECETMGLVATVRVVTSFAAMPVEASARAGPPP